MRSADRPHACFRQPEMPDLSLLDQILDSAGNILDRHGRIDAMLVEQIDMVGLEPLQRSVGDLPDMFGPAIEAELAKFLPECMPKLRRDHGLVAERSKGFAHDLFILVRAICFGGIKEGDTTLNGGANEFDRSLCISRWTITRAQPHTSEPNG